MTAPTPAAIDAIRSLHEKDKQWKSDNMQGGQSVLRHNEIDTLLAAIRERDATINTLREAVDECESACSDVEALHAESLGIIERFQDEVARLTSELAAANERLSRIAAVAEADAADMKQIRDGTKLTRHGLVETIAYWHETATERRAERDEANRRADEVKRERDELKDTLSRAEFAMQIYAENTKALTDQLAAANERADEAAAKERERIVAWLENEAHECDRTREMTGPLPDETEDMCFYGAGAYRHAADTIARGESQGEDDGD